MRAAVWLASAIALPIGAAQAQTFLTTPIDLSATGHAAAPAIAVGPSGDIDVVWLDSGAILFKRSVNGGMSFSANMTVAATNLPSQPSQPQIAVNAAGVYIAWAGTNGSGGGDIFFSSLANGASSWSSPVNASGGNGIAAGSSAPVPHLVAEAGGSVDLVWGQSAAYFARSTNGSSFTVTPLSGSAMASVSPRLAVNAQGTIYVVWENAGSCPTIMFARSTDSGASFGDFTVDDTLTVNGVTQTGCAYDVQIALGADSTIHLLWANDHSNVSSIRDLITTYQVDSGSSFAGFGENSHLGFQNLSSTASFTPQMAIDANGNVDVVWMADFNTNGAPQAVYFSRSADGGNSFGSPVALTSPPASGANAGFPQIAAEPSGAIDIIWQQASAANANAFDIILARSKDGVNFTQSTLDSAPTAQSGTGQATVDASGNVYAIWQGSSPTASDVLLNGDSVELTAAGSFSLSAVTASVSPLSAVINVGGSVSFSLLLHSANSVPGTVTLVCGGLPSGINCSFSPGSIALAANGTASATLNVTVSVKPLAAVAEPRPSGRFGGPLGGMAAGVGIWGLALLLAVLIASLLTGKPFGLPIRRPNGGYNWASARAFALMLLLIAGAAGLISCGGSTQGGGNNGVSITLPLTVQAQSGSSTTTLQTISVTVP